MIAPDPAGIRRKAGEQADAFIELFRQRVAKATPRDPLPALLWELLEEMIAALIRDHLTLMERLMLQFARLHEESVKREAELKSIMRALEELRRRGPQIIIKS